MALTTNLTAGDLLAICVLGIQAGDQVDFWNNIKNSSVPVLTDVGTYMHNHVSGVDDSIITSLRKLVEATQELQAIFPTLRLSVQDSDGRGQRDLVLDLGTAVAP